MPELIRGSSVGVFREYVTGVSCPGHIFTDNAMEELRSNRSRITTEMWNSVVRYGSSTDTQRKSTESDGFTTKKTPERHGLLRTDTVWYGATQIRTDALRMHYGLLRYKHGLVRISTVWYGEERIATDRYRPILSVYNLLHAHFQNTSQEKNT
jgi:hypothetical protein